MSRPATAPHALRDYAYALLAALLPEQGRNNDIAGNHVRDQFQLDVFGVRRAARLISYLAFNEVVR